MTFTPHWPKTLGKRIIINYKLDRILEVLRRLNNPHLKLPPVIHVGGTNGKGSTVAYLSQILRCAGYKVHTYISPHLIYFNERIILNNENISNKYLFEIMDRCRIAAESAPLIDSEQNTGLTLFEATTIASFIAFSEVPADFLVLEVGMGGRLDATNVVQNTILSIITPISLDHQEFLGSTEVEIAHEKAGIMRTKTPCVISKQESDVLEALERHAMALGTPVYRYGHEFKCEIFDKYFKYNNQNYPLPNLLGRHQAENASNAIAAIEILNSRYGCEIYYEDIVNGLQKTYWPARIEPIKNCKIVEFLPANWEIFLDGAHNAGGAEVLAQWAKTRQDKPIYLIFGTTKGKQLKPFLEKLKNHIKFVCGVCVDHETNAQRGDVIADAAVELKIPSAAFEYVPDALKFLSNTIKEPGIALICGSLYLAGDVMKINKGLL